MGRERGERPPELGVASAAPWPVMAGVQRLVDLGDEQTNQRHRGVGELTAIFSRAKTKSRRGRSEATTEIGGRRGSCKVQCRKVSIPRRKIGGGKV